MNTMKKTGSKWIALGAFLATQAAFAAQGGGLIGSGGDGLTPAGDLSPAGNVTVPVPDQISGVGQLQVVGRRGKDQDDQIIATKCAKDTNGTPKLGSCITRVSGKLNERVSLSQGFYLVSYSDSTYSELVEIKKNNLTVLNLSTIEVPMVNKVYKYQVFKDLTNAGEQDKFLKSRWGLLPAKDFLKAACALKDDALAKAACDAVRSSDYRNQNGSMYRFDTNGQVSSIFCYISERCEFRDPIKFEATDQTDGEFVSVFPGVYGITFTDTRTQETVTQWGILVD